MSLHTNLVMELAIHSLILSIDKLEGVRAIAVHVTVSIGSTSITKQEGDLVCGFGSEADKIPEHVRVLKNTEREREYACENLFYMECKCSYTFRWVTGFLFWVWIKLGNYIIK